MKNKHFSFVALAAAALATSCASDDLAEQKQEQNPDGTRTVTLTASVNEGQTRVGMTKESSTKASFYWHSSDKILVQTVNGSTYGGTEFSTTASDGDKTAKFTGEITEGKVAGYAVYPYDSEKQKHSFTGETALTYNLPAEYENYTPGSNIFSKDGSYPSNSTNMPMLGTIKDGNILFKCLGGLAVIRIDQMPAAEGTLTVTADQQLSGDFTVDDLSADGAEIATTTASDDNGKVTFTFSEAKANGVGVFYLPLATGSYSGVKIEVTYNGTAQTINYGSLSVNRANVTAIPLYATGTNGALTKFSKIEGNVYTINGHEFIDLGLSVLWAKTNVGADNAEDYGKYYAWGEVTAYNENTDWGDYSAKTNYKWETYKFGTEENLTKYCSSDGQTVLAPSDDAATVNWGSGVRMPTQEEAKEIVSNCTLGYSINSEQTKLYGLTATGKGDYTSSSILLPPASAYNGSEVNNDAVAGCWWVSTLESDANAYVLYFFYEQNVQNVYYQNRYVGCSVRAVTEKP